ncbi:hypothetical protein EPA93_39485 [Ktedonosporobacter rubrisoli]|uniref:Serine kinase n=1 Tax=Ktedonosporobacter rubrisoli TaxID=2509675 RepID=A0A4P6K1L4_KTERU|nr:hypothetical protein [Ktedonosporobacter rubrisoli]QBD81732.1 hypothetical protein EPA93_39485 [Ktedonosporobacter rubrisoli]
MYTAERQISQPYLQHVSGPLYEQWYLLHHRIVRVVTNRSSLAREVRSFLYYAELLAEHTYEQATQLPIAIPEALLWQAGQRLHRPVALTCYLFVPEAGKKFPPEPFEGRPEDALWEEISGIEGPLRARWKRGTLRFREYMPYPGVLSRIYSVLDTADLHATILLEDLSECTAWFIMRFVFYMALGAMFAYDGYEVVHAGAIAYEGNGMLLVGSPGSGKSTLVLSCLQEGMQLLADDVLFLAKDDAIVKMYAFPEDIGVRRGARELLGGCEFMQSLSCDEREKRFVDVQRYFRRQVSVSAPVRLLLFVHEERRKAEFLAEPITAVQAVTWLMQEYISHQRAQMEEMAEVFNLFMDTAEQAPAFALWLTPDARENAQQVRALLTRFYS